MQTKHQQSSDQSLTNGSNLLLYTRPQLPIKSDLKYSAKELHSLTPISNLIIDRSEYPTSGKHSRYPIIINCHECNQLAMTDIQFQHGEASCMWCFLLLPFLCVGFCCLCLNSCKDVKHFCSKCHKNCGICKSKFV